MDLFVVSHPGCPAEHVEDDTQSDDHDDYQHQQDVSCREQNDEVTS